VSAFTTQIEVRFGHVDPAGIAFFPRIYEYVHEVFEELWNVHVGERYYQLILQEKLGFPLVHSEVSFLHPLRFGDRPVARVTCFHLGRSSLGLRYQFLLDRTLCLDARMTTACVDLREMRSIAMPERFRTRFQAIAEPAEPVRGPR
jgi:4-hydroxybenzoyl-CoA thioesterase